MFVQQLPSSNPVTTLAGSIDAAQGSFCEIGLGRLVVNLSWERLSEDNIVTRGRLAGFGILFMAVAPLLVARIRGKNAALKMWPSP
jgi:hypothetical protein